MKTLLPQWKVIRDYCIGWTIACIFLNIIRGIGTIEVGVLKFGLEEGLLLAITFGPIIGIISGCWQLILEEKIYQSLSISAFLILRFFYAILFILLLIIISYAVYLFYFNIQSNILDFTFDQGALVVYFYVLSVDFSLNLLRQINLMLGKGNLGKLIRGDFYTPREEERIFMFIDLRSSTMLAEKLGNMKYSQLIQDCFTDLSVVMENGAEIYQYVGDEVVLTWQLKDGVKNQNCILAFFKFKERLAKRNNYYLNRYGAIPYFKAGINCGKVTAAEVGKFKKEIAYHGDAINTAARIQSKCNELNSDLLVSKQLVAALPTNTIFQFKRCGDVLLRGKKESTIIYSVTNLKNEVDIKKNAA